MDKDEVGRSCGTKGEERRVAYRDLLGRREGRRPLGTRTFRWDDNIKTDIEGIAWKGVDWIHLAEHKEQSRTAVSTATEPWVRLGYRIFTTPQFVLPNVKPFTSSAIPYLFFCLASFNFHFLLCFPLSLSFLHDAPRVQQQPLYCHYALR